MTLTFVGVMPRGRIQHRAWFVKFGLAVSRVAALDRSEQDRSENEQPTADLLATEIQRCLKDGEQIKSGRTTNQEFAAGFFRLQIRGNAARPC